MLIHGFDLSDPDAATRLVLADYLEERGELEPARRLRWWVKTRPRAGAALDWDGGPEWADVLPVIETAFTQSAWVCWLGCVLLLREVLTRYPVPYDRITDWPGDWDSERHREVLRQATFTAEASALGVITGDPPNPPILPLEGVRVEALDAAILSAHVAVLGALTTSARSAVAKAALSAACSAEAVGAKPPAAGEAASRAVRSAALSLFRFLADAAP